MANTNHQQSSPRAHTRASAAELREFLSSLKGKGPREVLGAVAQSHLGWALVQATVGCVVLLAVLTVVPYLMSRNAQADEKDSPATAVEKTPAKVDPKAPEPAKAAGTPDQVPAATVDTRKDAGKPDKAIVDKLKENEIKKGTPKDPFSPNLDDLLDK